MSGNEASFVTMPLLVAKASLILLIAWSCARWWRRACAATRHAIWGTALVAILALPLVAWLPLAMPVTVEVSGAPADVLSGLGVMAPVAPVVKGASDADRFAETMPDRAPAIPWPNVLLGIHALAVAAGLLRLAAGWVRVRGLVDTASPVAEHPTWRAVLEKVPMAGRARVRVSSAIHTPLACGLLRPTILLPWEVQGWTDEHRRSALVHEVAHLKRHDLWTQLLSRLASIAYWFHPGVHYAARRIRLEAERACDEIVVATGADPGHYAQHLVTLTRQRCRSRDLALVMPMAGRSDLWHRVDTILHLPRTPMKDHPLLATVAIALVAGGLLTAPLEMTFAHPHEGFDGSAPRGGYSVLTEAVRRGDVAEVRRLIDRGAAVGEASPRRGTPLIHATAAGHLEMVKLLIDAGADPNQVETAGRRGELLRSPLASAARGGHLAVVELLLAHGARVDLAPAGDATPLMEAAAHGHRPVAALLLDRGADVNRRIPGDGSPLIAAARGGDLAIVRSFVEAGARVNDGVPGDGSALIAAVDRGDRQMVEYLLAHGADPSFEVPGDESALVTAAEHGDRELLRILLHRSEIQRGGRSQ